MAPRDPSLDAQALHDAMKGAGTDEQAIIDILAKQSVKERKAIAESFKAQYGEDLMDKLKSELSGKFEQVVVWSFYTRPQVNAVALEKAMKGAGTKESILIDIICTANNRQINQIKEAYQEMTGNPLEDEIESETSGDFKKVLVAVLQGKRETDCNDAEARNDAAQLFEAGEDQLGTDESTITRILCSRSFEQIRLINRYYAELAGHDLLEAVKKETSGDYKKALSRIIEVSNSLYATIAEMLYKTMKGLGTDDDSLMRIILAHDNEDLHKIQKVFNDTYDKPLADMISDDTSGDYKDFLLAVLA